MTNDQSVSRLLFDEDAGDYKDKDGKKRYFFSKRFTFAGR